MRKRHPTTLFGIRCGQWAADVQMLEVLLQRTRPTRILEIGTSHGALASYFGIWGYFNGASVTTVDITHRHLHWKTQEFLNYLDVHIILGDCFAERCRLCNLWVSGEVFVYCDGGDKPRELEHFAPQLHRGDVIAAHDWAVEVDPTTHGGQWADRHRLAPFMEHDLTRADAHFMAWKKI